MEERYQRNIPALSEEECHLLRKKTVAVIGCGGLGGYALEMLSRIGVGTIRAVDGDVFEPSNLNRQLLSSPDHLGVPKAEAAAARIRSINPDVTVCAIPVFMDKHNCRELIQGCDAVVDALDSIESRRILSEACNQLGIPYIYGAIQGWAGQVCVILPGDQTMKQLYPEGTVVKDNSALSFTPALCASVQVSQCIKLLTGRFTGTKGIFFFDLLNQEFETIPVNNDNQ